MTALEKVLVIELNEFNTELLKRAADTLDLKNIKRILSFQRGITEADQHVEHHGLDPWVQWVSIHTESPSQEHGIIRLGDIPRLKKRQIWERLGEAGQTTTGVWGVMNASRRGAKNNLYFVTDPWTFSEAAYPAEVSRFLELPKYFSKNYLAVKYGRLLYAALLTAWYLLRHVRLSQLFSDGWFLLCNIIKMRPSTAFLFCAFELLSVRVFAKYRAALCPQVNFIFLNSIAHFQHHEWDDSESLSPASKFVFQAVDRMLSVVLPSVGASDKILILNGLSQRNVSHEHFYCYRQIDPKRFLERLGLRFKRLEQGMTNDAHVFFESSDDRKQAIELLSSASVAGQRAFYVERDEQNELKLFYQIELWDKVDDSALMMLSDLQIRFFDEFAIHAKRTGVHVSEGTYFAHGISLPNRVPNADILRHVWPVHSRSVI